MKKEERTDQLQAVEVSEDSLREVMNDNPNMEGNIEIEPGKYICTQSLIEENIKLKAMLEKRNKDVLELIEDLSDLCGVMYGIALCGVMYGIATSSLTKKKIKEKILEYLSPYINE